MVRRKQNKMKITLWMLLAISCPMTFAQNTFPDFLQGTWKVENEQQYEHWDKLNDQTLQGFSYQLNNGQMQIMEYSQIVRNRKKTIYTASVIDQNQGKSVSFVLSKNDTAFVFENPTHDFPKRIIYQKMTDTEIHVHLSDGNKKSMSLSYKMQKQITTQPPKEAVQANPNYDSLLAKKLGADDYGMKSYVLVILKTGTNQTTDQAFISACFQGHMKNITELVKEGKMIVAGPLGKNDQTYRGIFILDVTTFEQAQELLQTDLAVKEKLLAFELYHWYGSAALAEYLVFSDKIWKIKP